MMGIEDFVSIEQAQRLKALGCDIEPFACVIGGSHVIVGYSSRNVCNSTDMDMVDLYLLSQACKWLRSKGLSVQVYLNVVRTAYIARVCQIFAKGDLCDVVGKFDTYEQAQSAGIDIALSLMEQEGGGE